MYQGLLYKKCDTYFVRRRIMRGLASYDCFLCSASNKILGEMESGPQALSAFIFFRDDLTISLIVDAYDRVKISVRTPKKAVAFARNCYSNSWLHL